MAWCRPGDKPLSEPMMVRLQMHICITRPKWVKGYIWRSNFAASTVFADGLTLLGAIPSAGTMMTKYRAHRNTTPAFEGWNLSIDWKKDYKWWQLGANSGFNLFFKWFCNIEFKLSCSKFQVQKYPTVVQSNCNATWGQFHRTCKEFC